MAEEGEFRTSIRNGKLGKSTETAPGQITRARLYAFPKEKKRKGGGLPRGLLLPFLPPFLFERVTEREARRHSAAGRVRVRFESAARAGIVELMPCGVL